MKLSYDPHMTYCHLGLRDDYSIYTATLDWSELADLFRDMTEEGIDELDKVCIDRVLSLFAAYFDKHEYIGDEEYNRFEGILKMIREELQ